ncbi:hypothetical protein ANANG_G00319120, partial [Anguilla anguilla]
PIIPVCPHLHTGVSVLHTATHWTLCATHIYILESLCYTQLHTGVSVLRTATHWSLCATHSYTLYNPPFHFYTQHIVRQNLKSHVLTRFAF